MSRSHLCKNHMAYLEPLSHLQFVLIRKVLHQPGNLESLFRTFSKQLKGNDLKTMLDRVRDLAGVGTGDFGNRIRLTDHKEILNFTYEVFCVVLDSTPTDVKVSACGDRVHGVDELDDQEIR